MHQTFKTYWYHRIWGRMKSWQNQAAWFSGKTEPPAGSRWRSLGRTRRCQEIPSHSILLHPVPVRGVAKPHSDFQADSAVDSYTWKQRWSDPKVLRALMRLKVSTFQAATCSKMSTNYWRFNTEKQIRRPALPNKRYQVSDQQWRCWTRSQSGRPLMCQPEEHIITVNEKGNNWILATTKKFEHHFQKNRPMYVYIYIYCICIYIYIIWYDLFV